MKEKKRIKRYISYALGIILIAIAFNMIFKPNNYFSYGTMSIGILSNDIINPIIVIVFFNAISFFLSYILLDHKRVQEAFLSIFLFPIVLYVTSLLPNVFIGMDKYLTILVGGIMAGYGYGMIYKHDLLVDGFDIFELAMAKLFPKNHKLIMKAINASLLLICLIIFGFEQVLVSAIIYYIIVVLSNKVYLGISDSKTFFIITSKDKEIKDAIMEHLNENLTTIDVEGGYSKEKKRLIVSVINTREYYLLRELVKSIDSDAFITIIDSYQVINAKKLPHN